METLDQLLSKVSWDKTIEEQLDTLHLFDTITGEQIDELTSGKYVKSTEAGIVMQYLGFEKLKHKTDELLEFIQDMNWPAAGYVAHALIPAGEQIIPNIKNVFKNYGDDKIWVHWIIGQIIHQWEDRFIILSKEELLNILEEGDEEGASFEALMCLKRIVTKDEYFILANELLIKLKTYKHMEYEIQEIEEELKNY
ncbi:MAG: DUF5071 domain-containing protein [Bacteroidetes bacterium]|nr:MAG: DUF5071 domain-containing protein [Bacteroidota bacterium]